MKTLSPNTTIAHYLIIDRLGAGGMGEVWLAEDSRLKRKVALKILPQELVSDPDRVRRFELEAQSASSLNHPNIITVFDMGSEGDSRFMTTEFVDGTTLRQEMLPGRLSIGLVIDTAIQIAAALSAAHQAGITHRDIKPENVMLRRDGIVKVLDFGLAKLNEGESANEVDREAATRAKLTTDPGTVMGTPQYMSPEQARGEKIDSRTDIFSLGVMLYEMLAGRTPFEGVNAIDVISAILQKEPLPLSEANPDVQPELQRIVSKTLRKDRSERYQTAQDLLNDLKALRENLSSSAKHQLEGQTADAGKATISVSNQTTDSNQAQPTSPNPGNILHKVKRQGLPISLAAMLVIAAGSLVRFFPRSSSGELKSLAVLPFQNRSNDPDSEYLSDGLSESLILRLSQLPELKLSPTSTVFRYKGKDADPKKVADELGVDAVLTGRLTQRGDKLNITIELVDARNNRLLWGEQFERKLADLLTTQKEMAAEIANKLKLRLSTDGQQKLARNYTTNPEAYQLYLKGRYNWNKRTEASLKQAVDYFSQAIERDPQFALAYSGLAEAYVLFPNYSIALPGEVMPKAKAAALKAIELDDTHAETRTALGIYYSNYAWNMPAAEREFRRAIELNPNYAPAHQQFAIECLVIMKRFDEAIAEGRRAVELDPVSPIIGSDLGNVLARARRFDESIDQLNKVIALDGNFGVAYWYLGISYSGKRQYELAVEASRKSISINDNPWVRAVLIQSLVQANKVAEARRALAELEAESRRRYVPGSSLSIAYAALGDKDKAFAGMEREIEERGSRALLFSILHLWDSLKDDPRFDALLKKVEKSTLD